MKRPGLVRIFLAFLCLALATPSYAKWKDESGDLDFGSTAGVAVVVLVGVGAWLLLRNRGANREEQQTFSLTPKQQKSNRVQVRIGGTSIQGPIVQRNFGFEQNSPFFSRSKKAVNLIEFRFGF